MSTEHDNAANNLIERISADLNAKGISANRSAVANRMQCESDEYLISQFSELFAEFDKQEASAVIAQAWSNAHDKLDDIQYMPLGNVVWMKVAKYADKRLPSVAKNEDWHYIRAETITSVSLQDSLGDCCTLVFGCSDGTSYFGSKMMHRKSTRQDTLLRAMQIISGVAK